MAARRSLRPHHSVSLGSDCGVCGFGQEVEVHTDESGGQNQAQQYQDVCSVSRHGYILPALTCFLNQRCDAVQVVDNQEFERFPVDAGGVHQAQQNHAFCSVATYGKKLPALTNYPNLVQYELCTAANASDVSTSRPLQSCFAGVRLFRMSLAGLGSLSYPSGSSSYSRKSRSRSSRSTRNLQRSHLVHLSKTPEHLRRAGARYWERMSKRMKRMRGRSLPKRQQAGDGERRRLLGQVVYVTDSE